MPWFVGDLVPLQRALLGWNCSRISSPGRANVEPMSPRTNLFGRITLYRKNRFERQLELWPASIIDVVFSSPRPCFSGFESSSVSRKLEMISSEIVTLLRNSGRKIKRSTFHAKVNLSCKLYYKFYRVVACLVPR